jgi:hypothetical protein
MDKVQGAILLQELRLGFYKFRKPQFHHLVVFGGAS